MKDNRKFKFDICGEFDCQRWYCKEHKGYDCKGEFWKDTCIFHGEHEVLNLGKK